VNERLQTGNNPISVDIASIKDFDGDNIFDAVGLHFADAQGQSIVIAVDTGQDEPSIDDCPPPTPDEPTPTPTDTQPPTEPPTETTPPTEPPTESAPVETEPPSESAPPTEPPSVIIEQFDFEVCPDLAALIGGDTEDTVIESIPPGSSAIRIRALGALLLIALHVRVDGQAVVPDGDGVVLVTPGVHEVTVSNAADTEVLADALVDCPVCGDAPPPPDDITSPPKHTVPPTDTADTVGDNASTDGILPILLVLAAISGVSLILTRKQRVR
jgi:hypothetical protein